MVTAIAEILGKEELCELGLDIPRGKITDRQAVMLDKAEQEMPSMSDVAKADDIELQEITENAARSTENLIAQLEGESSENSPMRELLGLDKQLRSIWALLRIEAAKRFSWRKTSRKKSVSSRNSETILESTMMGCEKKLERETKSIVTN